MSDHQISCYKATNYRSNQNNMCGKSGCGGCSSGGCSDGSGWSRGGGSFVGSSSSNAVYISPVSPPNLTFLSGTDGEPTLNITHAKNGVTGHIQIPSFTAVTNHGVNDLQFNFKVGYPPCYAIRGLIALIINNSKLLGLLRVGPDGAISAEFYPFNGTTPPTGSQGSQGRCRSLIPRGTTIELRAFCLHWVIGNLGN